MLFRGNLSIDDDLKESKLDGTLLAVEGSGDPFGDATAFLENQGISNGDVSITGTNGTVGAQAVIFMTAAQALAAVLEVAEVVRAIIPPVPLTPRPPVKKKAPVRKAPARKPAPKKAPAKKQIAAKKTAPKKKASKKKTSRSKR